MANEKYANSTVLAYGVRTRRRNSQDDWQNGKIFRPKYRTVVRTKEKRFWFIKWTVPERAILNEDEARDAARAEALRFAVNKLKAGDAVKVFTTVKWRDGETCSWCIWENGSSY